MKQFNKEIVKEFGNTRSINHANRKYNLFRGDLPSEKWIGESDGQEEWTTNSDLSKTRFIHTESYNIFKRNSTIYLFGRRGSGKTAMLEMLRHEINSQQNRDYSYCHYIRQQETIYKLSMGLRAFTNHVQRNELTQITKEIFLWVIYIYSMIEVIKREKFPESLAEVKKYLIENNLISSENEPLTRSPISMILNIINTSLQEVSHSTPNYNIALINSIDKLESKEFKHALNALILFLNKEKKKCLILFDSQELYEFNDLLFENIITGLMSAALAIYKDSYIYNLFVKVAFPSEIVPHLKPENKGKTNDKSHFIFWKYSDLVKLLAKRYCILLEKTDNIRQPSQQDYNSSSSIILYKYMPSKILSFSGIEYDTISYVINHTQKKPREFIQLFNKILSLAHQNSIGFTQLTIDCIREGTNSRIGDLSSAIFGVYHSIYPNIDEIASKTFMSSKNVITYGELQKQMREAISIIGINNMSNYDIEKLCTETGIVGVIQSVGKFNDNKYLCQTVFEYQIKDVITLNSQDLLAIHPMFYEQFDIMAYENILIIPMPTNTEMEINLKYLS